MAVRVPHKQPILQVAYKDAGYKFNCVCHHGLYQYTYVHGCRILNQLPYRHASQILQYSFSRARWSVLLEGER